MQREKSSPSKKIEKRSSANRSLPFSLDGSITDPMVNGYPQPLSARAGLSGARAGIIEIPLKPPSAYVPRNLAPRALLAANSNFPAPYLGKMSPKYLAMLESTVAAQIGARAALRIIPVLSSALIVADVYKAQQDFQTMLETYGSDEPVMSSQWARVDTYGDHGLAWTHYRDGWNSVSYTSNILVRQYNLFEAPYYTYTGGYAYANLVQLIGYQYGYPKIQQRFRFKSVDVGTPSETPFVPGEAVAYSPLPLELPGVFALPGEFHQPLQVPFSLAKPIAKALDVWDGVLSEPSRGYQASPSLAVEPTLVLGPGGVTETQAGASGHRNEPPGKNTIERKGKAQTAFAVALRWALAGTEYVDFINVAYDSIDLRPGQRRIARGPIAKTKYVLTHLDQINIQKLAVGLVVEYWIDKAVGKTQAAVRRQADNFGINYGKFTQRWM